jgi:hypothetical protein
LLGLLLLSCEKEKTEVVDVSLASPHLMSLTLASTLVNLDTSNLSIVDHLADGSYNVSDTAFAWVDAPAEAPLALRMSYRLYQPGQPDYFASGSMQLVRYVDRTALFKTGFSFNLHRPDIGAYRIEVLANYQSDLPSNSLIASVVITRNNLRPRIFNLSAPDTLVRPASGRRPVFFAVSASDPDGQGDISTVFFRSINSSNPNFEFRLYDDGNLAVTGDSIAGNGRYSLIIPIDSTATLGTKEFRFWARDKSLALSDSLVHIITIISSP